VGLVAYLVCVEIRPGYASRELHVRPRSLLPFHQFVHDMARRETYDMKLQLLCACVRAGFESPGSGQWVCPFRKGATTRDKTKKSHTMESHSLVDDRKASSDHPGLGELRKRVF